MSDDWASVEAQIDDIIARGDAQFSTATISQIGDFLKLIRSRCAVPGVGKGFLSTLTVWWKTTPLGPLEIEIFDDRFEIYRFHDGHSDIRHVLHSPGEPFPADLIAELPAR